MPSNKTPAEPNPPEETVQSGLVDFAEPPAAHDPTLLAAITTVEEIEQVQEPSRPVISPEQYEELQRVAKLEDEKRDFLLKVAAARKQPVENIATPPVAERILEQTKAEMAAGAALVAKHGAAMARRPAPAPDRWDGNNNQSVLRPEAFDEYRTQFKTPGQTPSKDNVRQP